jgi:CDGSH-type Zn-finger protein
MSDAISITVLPDGPLKISGSTSATYCGEPLDAEGDLYLCRCGQSARAPFCDGSHKRVGFDGSSPSPSEGRLRTWEGRRLRTVFNAEACMHVLYCKPLKELRQRELAGDDEAAAQIIATVGACPSGALSYELLDDVVEPALPTPAADVAIIEGGEVRVQRSFDIDVPLLRGQSGERATLCRCGLSKNRPWCDGRHSKRDDFR